MSGDSDPLRAAILELLDRRAPGTTICPSEAARAVAGDDFRARMDDARAAAAQLRSEGRIEVTQRGEAVDPATARGPIRLRLSAPGAARAGARSPATGPGACRARG